MNEAQKIEAQAFENARAQEDELLSEMTLAAKATPQAYLLRVWGSAQSSPLFIARYGAPNELDFDGTAEVHARWFNTSEERDAFKSELQEFCKLLHPDQSTLVYSPNDETHNRKRVIAVVTVTYRGQEYVIKKGYGYGYPLHVAIFDWEENNTSCDCNRLPMLLRQHPELVLTDEEQALMDGNFCYEGRVMVKDFRFELLD
jgi:hypothetical protein